MGGRGKIRHCRSCLCQSSIAGRHRSKALAPISPRRMYASHVPGVQAHMSVRPLMTRSRAAQFMVVLDFSIVNVALPSMQKSLGFSPTTLQWVVSAYSLLFGGFLLLGGRAADLFGRRRVFLLGLVLFTLASLGGGFAQ